MKTLNCNHLGRHLGFLSKKKITSRTDSFDEFPVPHNIW